MSERSTLRNVGTIKSRRKAEYAADVHQQLDFEQLILIFVEDIIRDFRCINDPIERKYLRFDIQCLESCFTIDFRFRQELMIRLMYCLRIPAYFELDNGGYVNGQEEVLIEVRFVIVVILNTM
jgi:hypothetical protein